MAKRKQADHRAETRGQSLSGLPHVVADSPAYLALTAFERAVHAEILKRFNGYNNGTIAITYEEIGERLKGRNAWPPNNARIAKAVVTLMEHGLIAEPTLQSWLQRRARTYQLTYISSGKAPPFKPATNEYREWKPPIVKNNSDAPSPRKPRAGDAQSLGDIPASDARSPSKLENRSFACEQPKSPGDAQSSLICIPYPSRINGEQATASNLLAGPWQTGRCEGCGEPFEAGSRGKPKRFCSEQCRPPMPAHLEVQAAKARKRHKRRHAHPGVALEVEKTTEFGYRLASPHSDTEAWQAMICEALGTRSEATALTFLNHLVQLCELDWHPDDQNGGGEWVPDECQLNMILNLVSGIRPKNEMQAALAAQMVAVHLMMMEVSERCLRTYKCADPHLLSAASKLARTFAIQSETLAKLQGRKTSRQKITVAMSVTNTNTCTCTGGRKKMEANPMQRMAMHLSPRCSATSRWRQPCRSPAVRGKTVCRMHGGKGSGAPKGQANGAWTHGGWTDEAVSLRRAAGRLLRALRGD